MASKRAAKAELLGHRGHSTNYPFKRCFDFKAALPPSAARNFAVRQEIGND